MKASRVQVAEELANSLSDVNRTTVIEQAAAWLVNSGKQRQVDYLAQDVARVLAQKHGYVLARVTSARELNEQQLKALHEYVVCLSGAGEVEFELLVDPSVIGGVRIETPVGVLDETVRHRLEKLVRGINE